MLRDEDVLTEMLGREQSGDLVSEHPIIELPRLLDCPDEPDEWPRCSS